MPILFKPIEINEMVVLNRFVRSATNDRHADVSGRINDQFIAVYESLAAGGIGLIITGHAYVTWNGKASTTMMGVHDDDLVPDLRRLVEAVHQYESKIVMQLNHAGRQTSTSIIGETPVAPSAVYNKLYEETSRALTEDEIEELIEAYASAAMRAFSAGFDGVQIHAAHGYLASQFISPYTNRREDAWGGSLENRMRFPLEILKRIRKAVGDEYPVLIKLNSEDFLEGGLTIEEGAQIARALSRDGIDAIEISGGMMESGSHIAKPGIKDEEDEAYYLTNAIKFRKVIDVPLILVGGLRSYGLMEQLVEAGEADMVSLSRPFIREPDLVNRWKQGDTRKADCISCNGCQRYRDEPVRCIQLDN
jgi:2,4-dienoyl-CoA reductase-like NADH-dependent reductase (Old Yellow Enzyme family)